MFIAVCAVAGGGALGALARFGTVALINAVLGPRFPIGTLLVNGLGSFMIGFLMSFIMERFMGEAELLRLFLVVGFLGAYTTFSSFAWETWMLYANNEWWGALLNILLNNGMSLFLTLAGIQSARLLFGGYG